MGLNYFLDAGQRVFWVYIVSSGILAFLYIAIFPNHKKLLFSKKIWFSQSAKIDYQYFFLSILIKYFLIGPLLISAASVALFLIPLFHKYIGYVEPISLNNKTIMIFYTLALVIVGDFTRYWVHRFMHKIPFLWQFHKVHHSAEQLNPFTFYRVHPVENFLFGLRYAFSAGTVTAVFLYLFGAKTLSMNILGINIINFFFSLIAVNLRHSHIPFRFGFFENIFISPYMHQVHHDKNLMNKNYGGIFSFWDRLFGSYYAKKYRNLSFGIKGQTQNENLNVWDMLTIPFQNNFTSSAKKEQAMKRKISSKTKVLAKGLSLSLFIVASAGCGSDKSDAKILTKAHLGERLFHDKNLSKNRTQSCATCHNPNHAFVDNRANGINSMVSLGDNGTSLGDRNTPTAAYASFAPKFFFSTTENQYKGGQFLDGRAAGLAEQAKGPPLNPAEMNMPDKKSVVDRIKENLNYRYDFKALFGDNIFDNHDNAYDAMAQAIAAFEKTDTFSPFDSKYDRYLDCKESGKSTNQCLTEGNWSNEEELGMGLFFSQANTNCRQCHLLRTDIAVKMETFTNYEYHNIGVPANPAVKNHMGATFVDEGLYRNPTVNDTSQKGKFKVTTLRNVAVTGPYMHNGVFKELKTVILFYDKFVDTSNTINPETNAPWRAAEVSANISTSELTAMPDLNDTKINALVAFLKTLTDKKYEHLLE